MKCMPHKILSLTRMSLPSFLLTVEKYSDYRASWVSRDGTLVRNLWVRGCTKPSKMPVRFDGTRAFENGPRFCDRKVS